MRRVSTTILAALVLAVPASAFAGQGNPSGTGKPSQSCQEQEAQGGIPPGHASSSPGSPFNEPELNSAEGGTGGQHYNESSQYDVACYQLSH